MNKAADSGAGSVLDEGPHPVAVDPPELVRCRGGLQMSGSEVKDDVDSFERGSEGIGVADVGLEQLEAAGRL